MTNIKSWRLKTRYAVNFFDLLKGEDPQNTSKDLSGEVFDELDINFRPWYDEHIRPKIRQMEDSRIRALKKYGFRLRIAFPLWGAFLIAQFYWAYQWNLYHFVYDGIWWFFASVALFICFNFLGWVTFFSWSNSPVIKHRQTVKTDIFPIILKYFGDDFTFEEKGSLDEGLLKSLEIMPKYGEKPKHRNHITGSRNGTNLKLIELELERSRGENTRTVFEGLFVQIILDHALAKNLVINGNNDGLVKQANFSTSSDRSIKQPSNQEIKEIFKIQSGAERNTYDMLPAKIWSGLSDLYSHFYAVEQDKNITLLRGFDVCIKEKQIFIAIQSFMYRFEIGVGSIYEPVSFVDQINLLLSEIQPILRFIDCVHENIEND